MSFFFSREAFSKASPSGSQSMTAAGVKEALREIIRDEDKKKPLSDRLLSEKLAEKGIAISRRTVAKYREEEGIPDASGRKSYL